jgi:hypothetical protein
MTHISGKNGRVYSSALLVDNCESVWTTGGAGNAVSTVAGKVGTYCVRDTTTSIGANALLQYKAISSLNLSAYDAIYAWIRSSVTTAAGDLQIALDDTNTCASPIETLNIGALTAATWKQCVCRLAAPASDTAILAVGLKQITDLADGTFDVDDVEALAEIDGIKAWSLDYTADTLETTDFGSAGVKEYIIGGSGWSGSFDGFKDGVPLSIGSEVYLTLGESATAYQAWIGKAIITGAHPNTSSDGIVTYSYDYQGTGELGVPGA